MAAVTVPAGAGEMKISAVVYRADGRVENLGVVSYWNKKRRKRVIWNLKQWLKRATGR